MKKQEKDNGHHLSRERTKQRYISMKSPPTERSSYGMPMEMDSFRNELIKRPDGKYGERFLVNVAKNERSNTESVQD